MNQSTRNIAGHYFAGRIQLKETAEEFSAKRLQEMESAYAKDKDAFVLDLARCQARIEGDLNVLPFVIVNTIEQAIRQEGLPLIAGSLPAKVAAPIKWAVVTIKTALTTGFNKAAAAAKARREKAAAAAEPEAAPIPAQ